MKNDQRLNSLKAIAAGVAIAAGKRNGDEILGMLEAPATITKEIYAGLQQQAEWMDRDRACGQDAVDGFDEKQKLLDEIMEASPWTMHPDFGQIEKSLLAEYEESQLPSWAIARAKGYEEVGAQLCTKDGRTMGNAVVVAMIKVMDKPACVIVTDAGNMVTLTLSEMSDLFYPPSWIMSIDAHPGVQRRKNAEPNKEEVQVGLTHKRVAALLCFRRIKAVNMDPNHPLMAESGPKLWYEADGNGISLSVRDIDDGNEVGFRKTDAESAQLVGNRLTILGDNKNVYVFDLEDDEQHATRPA